VEGTVGRKCICNALVANIGLGQLRGRAPEPGIVTAGDDLAGLARFMKADTNHYSAADVIAALLPA
jgi:nitronate monooxygenase